MTSRGADPLRFDAATDVPHPSSSDDFPPGDSPGRVVYNQISPLMSPQDFKTVSFQSAREYILSLDVASIRHVVSILSESLGRLGQSYERT